MAILPDPASAVGYFLSFVGGIILMSLVFKAEINWQIFFFKIRLYFQLLCVLIIICRVAFSENNQTQNALLIPKKIMRLPIMIYLYGRQEEEEEEEN